MMLPIGIFLFIDNYRYKRPVIQSKTEGKGNGIKTIIVNIVDVANALHRKPGDITKFFGCELGAQSKYDESTQKAKVNGLHSTATLEEYLEIYIEKFVLCPKCNLPETELKIKSGKDVIYHKCDCCGGKSALIDPGHKLCTTMLKEAKSRKKEKNDNEKKEKKEKKKEKEKEKKSHEEKEIQDEEENVIDGNEDEIDNEAIKNAAESLSSTIQNNESLDKIYDDINSLYLSAGINNKYGKILLLFDAIYGFICTNAKLIYESGSNTLYKSLFNKYVKNDETVWRLLACLERFYKIYPEKSKYIPAILQALYYNDIVTESQINNWYNSDHTLGLFPDITYDDITKAKDSAQPCIEWLRYIYFIFYSKAEVE